MWDLSLRHDDHVLPAESMLLNLVTRAPTGAAQSANRAANTKGKTLQHFENTNHSMRWG